MGRIAVVGSINTDLNVLADRLPRPGETVVGGSFFQAPGGKGANQAVAAARAGADVTMIGAVGRDAYGDDAVAALTAEGINVGLVRRVDHPSGVALILIGADGENLISVASGANHAVTVEDVDAATEEIAGCDLAIFQLELPPEVVWHGIRRCAERGVPALLNPAPAPADPIPPDVLGSVGVLVPNRGEIERIVGRQLRTDAALSNAASALREMGLARLVCTLGGAGVFVVDESGERWEGAFNVAPVDTVGAGDAFCGALGAALAEPGDFAEAIRFAQAAAALATTRKGAQPSMPSRAAILEQLAGS